MGVRFGAVLARQCDHPAVSRFVLWDPIATGKEYVEWLAYIDAELKDRHRSLAREINQSFENIHYENFDLGEKLIHGIERLTLNKPHGHVDYRVSVVTTDKSSLDNHEYTECEFTGFEYRWPSYHEGNLHPRPVLETIAKMVLK